MKKQSSEMPAADFQYLLAQLQQLQATLSEQQRTLLRVPDGQAKATAIRGSGVLTRRLDALSETAGQLQKESARQEIEKERLLALQEVGAAINSSLDLDVVLQQVMDAIIRLTNAERAMLLLVNDGDLEVKIARNISQETLDNAASLEISHSIVRKVAESGEPIVSINAQEDERFALQHSIVSYKLRSIVCAPLKIKGETTGVIYADNRVASGIFSDTDRDLLAVFADQAAVAIDNARLFHEVAGMKHLMDNVFASIAGGVITIDENDRIALFNRAAERILGMSAEPLHLRTYQDVLSLLGLPVESLIHQAKEDGQTHSAELDLGGVRRRNSPVTVNVTVSPLSTVDNERVGGVAIVIDDVSEKKRVESLRRYLPPALVDRVRDLDAAQKPQRRPITVMFADIRDFSRFGEHVDPEELIDLANGLFSEAVAAISAHHGLIDKFMGDAVMALFNTPLNPQEDHVEQAVAAALDVQARMVAYRSELPSSKLLHFGIGIHTGDAVVGNVGSAQRKDYSAVGDVVNLCKRLQELAGADQIIISRRVYEHVRDYALVESLAPVKLRGRKAREEVYRLLDAGKL
ncbi:MAG TPA: adenylate/guanylate cyclase domain-containing protein [Promineifilum sp.]|nr:adenylate/guanylate cyclase domain-containing protein [Promineifilum sp.]HRO23766.1 adenylate/guanylate cyclase domain-containing protein [Promineifilum sp.]HRO90282.1 adenylate/guanylate cyclase domain-containing protein [Promineifilum sp.]HRQ12914.1 adenylate/guanylate cyclase domain-containing protein [Promineifilum sp.]